MPSKNKKKRERKNKQPKSVQKYDAEANSGSRNSGGNPGLIKNPVLTSMFQTWMAKDGQVPIKFKKDGKIDFDSLTDQNILEILQVKHFFYFFDLLIFVFQRE
jgi:hypothetical protein